jgi:YVTN family beta-propeller protein
MAHAPVPTLAPGDAGCASKVLRLTSMVNRATKEEGVNGRWSEAANTAYTPRFRQGHGLLVASVIGVLLALLLGALAASNASASTAYVAIDRATAFGVVTPIDVATNTPGANIAVGQSPTAIAITPDGKTAYVTNGEGDSVTPIDLATNTPGPEIKLGTTAAYIAITPDGKTAYVTTASGQPGHWVIPIDLATNTPGANIEVGPATRGIAISPDGKTAYVVVEGANSVRAIDLATNTPGAEIEVGERMFAIAITPDGKAAYVSQFLAGESVTPIDLATNTPGAAIKVGGEPGAIAITPDGKTAYVTNAASDSVTPIDVATNTPGAEIEVRRDPRGIAITPDGKTAYVANFLDASVTPIDLATNTPGESIFFIGAIGGPHPIAIAFAPSNPGLTPTSLTTSLSGEGKSGASITVKEGAPVTDSATLSGENAAKAAGTITYKLYSDGKCEQEVASAGTVSVSEGKVPDSEAKTLAPGTYYWQAAYSGDVNNGRSTSECGAEIEKVERLEPRCPVNPPKVNVRWHYSANGTSGSWSGTREAKCGQTITMGPQAMEGDLKVSPGVKIKAGYDFTLPGNSKPFGVSFSESKVVFKVRCVSGKAPSEPTFTVPLPNQSYAVTNAYWYPSGNQSSPLVYQAEIAAPPLCGNTGQLRLNEGGTFSTFMTLH